MEKVKKADKVQNSMENSIETKYQIKRIEVINFTLIPPLEITHEFHFDVQIQQQVQQKENLVMTTIILGIKDSKNISLGSLTILCVFEVEELNKLIKNKELMSDFSLKLNTITISTARGVMFGLFRGTFLHPAILPIVDVKVLQNQQ